MSVGVQTGRSATANGDIHPFCAVMIDTSTNNRLIEATAAARAIGIAGKGRRYAPWTAIDDGLIAVAGEVFNYWGEGEEHVPAKIGGTVTAGDRLKVTTGGVLIATTADGDLFIAIAREGGAADDIIAVDVVIGQVAA
jgi:hypothetical protein